MLALISFSCVVAAHQQQVELRSSCITATDLTVRCSGSLSSAATSSQVFFPGVGTFFICFRGGLPRVAGASASASSTLAA